MELRSPTGPITAAIAMDAIDAASRWAQEIDVSVSVAIVDSGGNLKAFLRMDGAEIAGPILAVDKAYTAVSNRITTHALGALAQPGQPLFGLHTGAGGRYVIYGGGSRLCSGTKSSEQSALAALQPSRTPSVQRLALTQHNAPSTRRRAPDRLHTVFLGVSFYASKASSDIWS